MGSFTTNTANVIMASIFPYVGGLSTGTLGRIMANTSAVTGSEGFRIYSTANSANSIGIYAGLSGAASVQGVAHAIYLIKGTTANTGPAGTPITDANFTANGWGLTGTTTAAGTLNFLTATEYPSAQNAGACQIMGSTTVAANAWSGWFLGASGGLPAVTNNGQITFSTMTAGSAAVNIVGFAITATPANLTLDNTKAAPTTTTVGTNSGSATALPAIIAYGDLNTFRSVQGSDTPVFTGGTGTAPTAGTPGGGITTNGAIVITLD